MMNRIFTFAIIAIGFIVLASCNGPIHYLVKVDVLPHHFVEVGEDMSDGKLFDIDGNKKHLSDYLDKYILLNIWSAGCGYTVLALPEMKEISETYHDKLTVVSINYDTDDVWKEKLMTTHDISWVNLRDSKRFCGLFAKYSHNKTIPYFVIISPDGKVIDKWSGYGDGYIKKKVDENINSVSI